MIWHRWSCRNPPLRAGFQTVTTSSSLLLAASSASVRLLPQVSFLDVSDFKHYTRDVVGVNVASC